jgi:hypothetical protein
MFNFNVTMLVSRGRCWTGGFSQDIGRSSNAVATRTPGVRNKEKRRTE